MKPEFEEVIPLLARLVKQESPYFHEDAVMADVSQWLSENGIANYIQEYHEEKVTGFKGKNVISVLDSGRDGPVVYLNGHLDTVMLCSGWTKDPYNVEIEDGKLYGLGALDMKSGCAAIMVALKQFLAAAGDSFRGKIITTFVSDEEGPYGLGTNAVIEAGILDRVDVSLVAEPSAGFAGMAFPCLCLGARGGYGLSVEFYGKSAHAANPELGVNAAVEAGKMMAHMDSISFVEDPKLGVGSMCVVKVESDGGACSVPDFARVQLFRHTVRGETKETIIEELEQVIAKAGVTCGWKIVFRDAPSKETEAFQPYTVDEDDPYVVALIESCRKVTGKEPVSTSFSSIGDFNYVGSRLAAPCIIFGADGKRYHSADEYVTVESLTQTTAVLYDYLMKLLCGSQDAM